jgi:hypothetical protein
MTAEKRPLKRERLGEPAEFPAPPPELMARLRAMLPPVQQASQLDEPLRRSA